MADDPEPVTARMALGHVDVCRTRVPWVCTTPFGSAVDPEVCIMTAGSAGETSLLDSAQNIFRHKGIGVIGRTVSPNAGPCRR